ncbi:hypothetical protein SNEBB_003565 [Seison nebaliae]|nr:hypothetical protein SNEBB_003565 [Seison nebaliae]
MLRIPSNASNPVDYINEAITFLPQKRMRATNFYLRGAAEREKLRYIIRILKEGHFGMFYTSKNTIIPPKTNRIGYCLEGFKLNATRVDVIQTFTKMFEDKVFVFPLFYNLHLDPQMFWDNVITNKSFSQNILVRTKTENAIFMPMELQENWMENTNTYFGTFAQPANIFRDINALNTPRETYKCGLIVRAPLTRKNDDGSEVKYCKRFQFYDSFATHYISSYRYMQELTLMFMRRRNRNPKLVSIVKPLGIPIRYDPINLNALLNPLKRCGIFDRMKIIRIYTLKPHRATVLALGINNAEYVIRISSKLLMIQEGYGFKYMYGSNDREHMLYREQFRDSKSIFGRIASYTGVPSYEYETNNFFVQMSVAYEFGSLRNLIKANDDKGLSNDNILALCLKILQFLQYCPVNHWKLTPDHVLLGEHRISLCGFSHMTLSRCTLRSMSYISKSERSKNRYPINQTPEEMWPELYPGRSPGAEQCYMFGRLLYFMKYGKEMPEKISPLEEYYSTILFEPLEKFRIKPIDHFDLIIGYCTQSSFYERSGQWIPRVKDYLNKQYSTTQLSIFHELKPRLRSTTSFRILHTTSFGPLKAKDHSYPFNNANNCHRMPTSTKELITMIQSVPPITRTLVSYKNTYTACKDLYGKGTYRSRMADGVFKMDTPIKADNILHDGQYLVYKLDKDQNINLEEYELIDSSELDGNRIKTVDYEESLPFLSISDELGYGGRSLAVPQPYDMDMISSEEGYRLIYRDLFLSFRRGAPYAYIDFLKEMIIAVLNISQIFLVPFELDPKEPGYPLSRTYKNIFTQGLTQYFTIDPKKHVMYDASITKEVHSYGKTRLKGEKRPKGFSLPNEITTVVNEVNKLVRDLTRNIPSNKMMDVNNTLTLYLSQPPEIPLADLIDGLSFICPNSSLTKELVAKKDSKFDKFICQNTACPSLYVPELIVPNTEEIKIIPEPEKSEVARHKQSYELRNLNAQPLAEEIIYSLRDQSSPQGGKGVRYMKEVQQNIQLAPTYTLAEQTRLP